MVLLLVCAFPAAVDLTRESPAGRLLQYRRGKLLMLCMLLNDLHRITTYTREGGGGFTPLG